MATTTLMKWGNSSGIIIPKSICDLLGLERGDSLAVAVRRPGVIEITPETTHYRRRNQVSIDELFANYESSYKPEELDWGASVGKEMW
ncbi:MAG: AbrB/MazE/SpoVT family DNA-binding domain-containing protein [Coriobacteriia bacterium]|nr:AbrB/MazE/SpoVT family DNA-binding domain-containing protein [Coriobacteriia bacterium]